MAADAPKSVDTAQTADAIKPEPKVYVEVLVDAAGDVKDTELLLTAKPEFDLNRTHIVSSPYTNLANQLHLEPLDLQSRLFAFALTYLSPVQDNYATAPYTTAFNWPFVFETLSALCNQAGILWTKQEFYVVIFRSKLLAEADRGRLGELDQKSHEEACSSGGLLHYWFGETDAERRNLATCIWVTREDAAAGGRGPWHKKARGAAREMYETISFHTHSLVVEDGAKSWELNDYVD